MTKEQVNAVMDLYGGKEEFLTKHLHFIQLDNSNFIYRNYESKPEEILEQIVFDDENELVIYKKPDPLPSIMINDFTPIYITEIFPYDCIQEFSVIDKLAFKNKD